MLVTALFLMIAGVMVLAGVFEWKSPGESVPKLVLRAFAAALGLAVLQEILFRGIAMGIFLRAMRPAAALGILVGHCAVAQVDMIDRALIGRRRLDAVVVDDDRDRECHRFAVVGVLDDIGGELDDRELGGHAVGKAAVAGDYAFAPPTVVLLTPAGTVTRRCWR